MRVTVCGLLLCASLVSSALAEDATRSRNTFQEVMAQLAAPAVLRGNFTQTRKIELIDMPLRSSGSFVLSSMGLYWQQDEPLDTTLIADGERLLQRVGDGPLQSIDIAQNPMVLTFSKTFLSIVAGSETEIRSNFDIDFTSEDEVWKIALTPTSYPMSEAIDSIVLRGREHIEALTVIGRSSDTTMISFTDLQTQPEQLTDDEIELYAR